MRLSWLPSILVLLTGLGGQGRAVNGVAKLSIVQERRGVSSMTLADDHLCDMTAPPVPVEALNPGSVRVESSGALGFSVPGK